MIAGMKKVNSTPAFRAPQAMLALLAKSFLWLALFATGTTVAQPGSNTASVSQKESLMKIRLIVDGRVATVVISFVS